MKTCQFRKVHIRVLLWGMRIHWVKCCKCNEVKVYEDLPVQESTCTSTAVGNAYTLGIKCCDCTEVKVYEDLPVQESTCMSTAVGNEYTGLNVLTVMRFNCLKAWKFRT